MICCKCFDFVPFSLLQFCFCFILIASFVVLILSRNIAVCVVCLYSQFDYNRCVHLNHFVTKASTRALLMNYYVTSKVSVRGGSNSSLSFRKLHSIATSGNGFSAGEILCDSLLKNRLIFCHYLAVNAKDPDAIN